MLINVRIDFIRHNLIYTRHKQRTHRHSKNILYRGSVSSNWRGDVYSPAISGVPFCSCPLEQNTASVSRACGLLHAPPTLTQPYCVKSVVAL